MVYFQKYLYLLYFEMKMEVYFETLKSTKFKNKIYEINKFIELSIKKIKLGCDNVYIYWSPKKFQKILGKKKFLPSISGGRVFAIVNQSNEDDIEVYLSSDKLQEFSLDFFKFGFLHEIAHFVLQNESQIFVEDIKYLNSFMKKFLQKNKELKNGVDFLNYIIDDVSVDMNFIEKHRWSKSIFVKASKYMLKRYVEKEMFEQNTETRINCLFYVMSASRFFIPVGFLTSSRIIEYGRLLSYFKQNKESEGILRFNEQITDFIYYLYNGSSPKKLLKLYSRLLETLKELYCNCLVSYPIKC